MAVGLIIAFAVAVLGAQGLRAPAKLGKDVLHLWPSKNGNNFRNGKSLLHSGPLDLKKPLWEWVVPGHDAQRGHIESTPLIDKFPMSSSGQQLEGSTC
jgi:hypothetical protein